MQFGFVYSVGAFANLFFVKCIIALFQFLLCRNAPNFIFDVIN